MDRKRIIIIIFLSIILVMLIIKKWQVNAKQTETIVAVSSVRIASVSPHVNLIDRLFSGV